MRNFTAKLFQESPIIEVVTASYLEAHGVAFDRSVLEVYSAARPGTPFPDGAFERGARATFVRLESEDWQRHNVETFFEHVWNTFGAALQIWDDLVYNGIYFSCSWPSQNSLVLVLRTTSDR